MNTNQYHSSNLMSRLTSNQVLDCAFDAVYHQRITDGPNSVIWSLSLHWKTLRTNLREQLLSGTYLLSPVSVFRTKKGCFSRFSAQDAIVLKALTLCLTPRVVNEIVPSCHHLRGNDGLKGAIRSVGKSLKDYHFVIKSDVHQFYESMNHQLVMAHCKTIIQDPRVLNLISQYLNRCEVFEGDHHLIEQGKPKGCPLSPLMGALILKSLDACVPKEAFYARFMDDWVILVKTKTQLRCLVKKMHQVMQGLKFKLELNKTLIGRIQKGFDFLGYRFNHQGIIGLAKKTVQNFIERITTLYEPRASDQRVREYVRRWMRWCVTGV